MQPLIQLAFRGQKERLALIRLKKSSAIKSLLAFGIDWLLISTSVVVVAKFSLAFLPLSLLIIGSRQRALSNLIHDASHRNLFPQNRLNDWITNFFAAFPMLESVRFYRNSHMLHHRHLGSGTLDPDSASHLRYGYHDLNLHKKNAFQLYLKLILNRKSLKDSFFGNIFSLSLEEKLFVLLEWLMALALISILFEINLAITYFLLWNLSRATTYHAIRIFSEFLDHTGLRPDSILEFTRTLPHSGMWSFLFHPHEDTYHLAHHLIPKVPHYHLKKAHDILLNQPIYQNAHHCDGYFTGNHSALNCWIGQCHKALQKEAL